MSQGCNKCTNKKRTPLGLRIKWGLIDLKYKIQARRLHKHINYITKYSKNSAYVQHALDEMRRAWPEAFNCKAGSEDEMQKYMCDQVIEILSLLHTQGDTGSTIGYKMHLLNKLVHFGVLSPLTFAEDEWGDPFDLDDTRMNKRCSGLFYNSKETIEKYKYHYNHGISKRDKYFVKEDENGKLRMVTEEHSGELLGGAFVIRPDGTVRYSDLRAYIKDPKTFNPETHFSIPSYQIEYPEGWWMSFVSEEDLEAVKGSYNVKYESKANTETLLEKEINFKDGKYADELRRRIDFVIKHITKPTKAVKKSLKAYVNEQRANNTSQTSK